MSDDLFILDEAGSIAPDEKESKPDLDKFLILDRDNEFICPECGEPASAHY